MPKFGEKLHEKIFYAIVFYNFMTTLLGVDAAQGMRITLDPKLQAPVGGSINRGYLLADTKIVVNLFDGGARDSVRLSLNGAPAQDMFYRVRTDPFVERVHEQLQGTPQATGRTHRSAHIWELALPDHLSTGLHRLEVTSEDEFGQKRSATLSFEVLAP